MERFVEEPGRPGVVTICQHVKGKHNLYVAASGVGGAHSSWEIPETGWSKGALLKECFCKIGGMPIG